LCFFFACPGISPPDSNAAVFPFCQGENQIATQYISGFIVRRNLAKAGFSYISTRWLKPDGNEIEYRYF
jgi:hypothetical protein